MPHDHSYRFSLRFPLHKADVQFSGPHSALSETPSSTVSWFDLFFGEQVVHATEFFNLLKWFVVVTATWLACSGVGWSQELSSGDIFGHIQPDMPIGKKDEGVANEKKISDDCSTSKKELNEKDREESLWSKVPAVRIFPRLGFFPNPPTSPGYYSLLDWIKGNERESPPKYGYLPSALMAYPFFDADFRYLDDSKSYAAADALERLHRVYVPDNWLFATGGQFWWRHMHEINSRLTGNDNEFGQLRLRMFADLCLQDRFRAFVEFIYADTFNNDLEPLGIDGTRADLLNAFIDCKVADIADAPAYLRVGRQQMMLGSQRLVSPLDWANTPRSFQGARMFRQGKKFDVDLFWLQPVLPSLDDFDSVDNDQNFAGLWTTYRREKGRFFDLYYLFLDDTSPRILAGEVDPVPFNVHTFGFRTVGNKEQFLWDVEGDFQVGDRRNENTLAGAFTIGGGYHFKDRLLDPTFWIYFDYASGDSNPGGEFNTFNPLYPFGHYYLGWIDLVGRQNIYDLNCHLYLYPTNWITFWLQFHHFELASARDALYSAAGVPLRRDPTGAAGRAVGNEIDIVVNFHLSKRFDVMLGYSHLFAGDFIRNTAPTPAAARDAEFFFAITSVRW